MWRVNHQKCGLFYGPAAAILQIAHPRIAQGVADHSNFEYDTLGRLNRTLAATNRIAFGTIEEAEAIREKLRNLHRGVKGEVSSGMEGGPKYTALEPDLLLWVLATLIMAALQGYEMVYGSLPAERKERFYREMREFGTYFGLDEGYGPADMKAFGEYYETMLRGDLLGSHPLCRQLAMAIVSPKDSRGAKMLGDRIRFLSIETLPAGVRERLGFRSTAFTRGSMWALRKTSRLTFSRLPKKVRCFPEAIQREERESGICSNFTAG